MKFKIPIEPAGKKEARRNLNGHVYKHAETRKSMEEIADHIRRLYHGEPMDCPLQIRIRTFKSRPKSKKHEIWADRKPDADNIQKMLGDALEKIIWVNDSRIVDVRCLKFYAPPGKPGWVEIEVNELKQRSERIRWLAMKNRRRAKDGGLKYGHSAVTRSRRIRRHPALTYAAQLDQIAKGQFRCAVDTSPKTGGGL